MQNNIAIGISLPKQMMARIDSERGDISRSRFLLRILENMNKKRNGQIAERRSTLNKNKKPLQANPRVGSSFDQSAMDDTKTALESDPVQ